MSKNNFHSPDGLSRVMAGRYHALFPRYKERTLTLLSLVSSGNNSFNAVETRSDAVNSSIDPERAYYRSLTGAVVLGVALDSLAISKIVCDARSRHGYPRFKGNIPAQCIKELLKLFIVKVQLVAGADGRNHKVYVPMFALLAE